MLFRKNLGARLVLRTNFVSILVYHCFAFLKALKKSGKVRGTGVNRFARKKAHIKNAGRYKPAGAFETSGGI